MWKSPDPREHSLRLRQLLNRFRVQELSMTAVLLSLQAQLEVWHRGTSSRQLRGDAAEPMLRRCIDLQAECDQIANELAHVRMAISGAAEELADHEDQVASARSLHHTRRQATPA